MGPGALRLAAMAPASVPAMTDVAGPRRLELRAERAVVAPFRAGSEERIIITAALFAAAWLGVIALEVTGRIPLWPGLVANTVLAATFSMPRRPARLQALWLLFAWFPRHPAAETAATWTPGSPRSGGPPGSFGASFPGAALPVARPVGGDGRRDPQGGPHRGSGPRCHRADRLVTRPHHATP